MPFHPCPSGCGFYISPSDRHDCCVQCLGCARAEAALVDGSCPFCEDMVISALLLPVPLLLPLGMRPQRCASGKSMWRCEWFCRVSPHGLLFLLTLCVFWSSFHISLRACLRISSITQSELAVRISCQLQLGGQAGTIRS